MQLFSDLLEDRKKRIANIIVVEFVDWQYPSLTEKQAYYNHIFHHNKPNPEHAYFAFPWATLIDVFRVTDSAKLELQFVEELKRKLEEFKGRRIHTVCQHIRWKMLKKLWEHIGITDAHLSHYEINVENTDALSFHPWTLIATNYENPERNNGLCVKSNKDKSYLASFVGNHNEFYRSEIRTNLVSAVSGRKDVYYDLGEDWFYQTIVYGHQMSRYSIDEEFNKTQNRKTERYNNIISDSIFSLCPEGSGPNTIRLWESMAVGSIPVIFADTWKPPQIKDFNWDEFSVRIPIENYSKTMEILDAIDDEKREMMKNKCLTVYNKFASMRCFT